jgi:two-component system, response regulator PdtaR
VATVLIVEDEFLVRNVLQIEPEEAGYDVILADNADAAIAILEGRGDVHLVFTDINMPGSMDGLKLAAYVRDRWPPIHIIITTGNARPSEIDSRKCALHSEALCRSHGYRRHAYL